MIRQFCIVLVALSTVAVTADEPPAAPKVGESAPEFTVEARDGTKLKLSELCGKSHLVVVFGRAHW